MAECIYCCRCRLPLNVVHAYTEDDARDRRVPTFHSGFQTNKSNTQIEEEEEENEERRISETETREEESENIEYIEEDVPEIELDEEFPQPQATLEATNITDEERLIEIERTIATILHRIESQCGAGGTEYVNWFNDAIRGQEKTIYNGTTSMKEYKKCMVLLKLRILVTLCQTNKNMRTVTY